MPTRNEGPLTVLTGCDWLDCPHLGTLVQEGRHVYCPCHLGDDMLPALEFGVLGACAYCGFSSIWWTAGGWGSGVCVHEWCRKPWMASGSPERYGGGAIPLARSAPKKR